VEVAVEVGEAAPGAELPAREQQHGERDERRFQQRLPQNMG
jgi:hypothetical protein